MSITDEMILGVLNQGQPYGTPTYVVRNKLGRIATTRQVLAHLKRLEKRGIVERAFFSYSNSIAWVRT
ncbi:hypothetical protein C8N35_102115 [Breoghania corrubedonensis]|uniref:LexA repressor DNA-binding domain-containing protein n=1 Tax=Breoghania corrubedonensis TaxID=665038 RepID=A0A2T5VCD1_9HYPH|nr:hypothetical protein [Breoghania corrubedonensis]PTW61406.1 hypothetical protein C8N35_102115 [Breoghania corrubedonensis]